jgi:glutamate racemase
MSIAMSSFRSKNSDLNLLVFDSGIGGLGVVAEIRRLQPGANIAYLADTAFYPYGEKPDDLLIGRILQVIGQGICTVQPDAVVIACNTASTVALGHLRNAYAVPFIGCVPPVKPAAAASKTRHIGLLATSATIRRPYLQELIQKFAEGCVVHSHGTASLADLAEAKFRGRAVSLAALAAAIAPLLNQHKAERIDSIALGCTHYTFLLPELLQLHPKINWFDPAGAVARQTAAVTSQLTAASPSLHAGMALFTKAADAKSLQQAFRSYGFTRLETLPADAVSARAPETEAS